MRSHKRAPIGLGRCFAAVAMGFVLFAGSARAEVGDIVHQIVPEPESASHHCSVGLAFDGESLYFDRCGDSRIYRISPISGQLLGTFDSQISENPNAMAYDAKRHGMWIGSQACNDDGMPIYFWDMNDDSVTLKFTVANDLVNPATGFNFLFVCFDDGLAYNENNPGTDADDEIWFNDDINPNIAVFRPDGTFVKGYDAREVHSTLATMSGIAIGGDFLYMGNDGHGDVFRGSRLTDPLSLVDMFSEVDARQEDLECDPVTFAPTQVMWVRTTPQSDPDRDLITAYEIEPGSCGVGGSEAPPPPPIPTLSQWGMIFLSLALVAAISLTFRRRLASI